MHVKKQMYAGNCKSVQASPCTRMETASVTFLTSRSECVSVRVTVTLLMSLSASSIPEPRSKQSFGIKVTHSFKEKSSESITSQLPEATY